MLYKYVIDNDVLYLKYDPPEDGAQWVENVLKENGEVKRFVFSFKEKDIEFIEKDEIIEDWDPFEKKFEDDGPF